MGQVRPAQDQAAPHLAVSSGRWVTLTVLCLVDFMLVIDETVVNVAMPSIRAALGFSLPGLAWVADAYWLLYGGFLLLGGRAGDLIGRRRIFLGGLSLFTAASLGDGLARTPVMLIVSRASQGLGAALAAPASLALIQLLFPRDRERARALGIWGGIAGMGGAAGLLLGGALTDSLSWRWIFLINVPVGGVVLLLMPRLISRDAPQRPGRIDLPGAVAVTGGMLALVYALLASNRYGWASPVTTGAAAVAAVFIAGFLAREQRAASPLVPLQFFRDRATAAAQGLALMVPVTFAGTLFLLTLYLQTVAGYSALKTGLAYLPLVAAMLIAIPLASRWLIPWTGPAPVLAAGLVLMAVGSASFTGLPVHGSYPRSIMPGLMLIGFGAGWSFIPVTIMAVRKARAKYAGLAAGVFNGAQQIGGALALAIYVAVAQGWTGHLLRAGHSPSSAQTGGYRAAFWAGAGISAAAAILAAVGPRPLHPYRALLTRLITLLYRQVSAGRYRIVLALCTPHVHATMAGETPISGSYPSRRSYRGWFERVTTAFALNLEVHSVGISGPPWHIHAVVAWTDQVTARDGRAFTVHGLHQAQMRWGRITSIHYDWDTNTVAAACAHAASLGQLATDPAGTKAPPAN